MSDVIYELNAISGKMSQFQSYRINKATSVYREDRGHKNGSQMKYDI